MLVCREKVLEFRTEHKEFGRRRICLGMTEFQGENINADRLKSSNLSPHVNMLDY